MNGCIDMKWWNEIFVFFPRSRRYGQRSGIAKKVIYVSDSLRILAKGVLILMGILLFSHTLKTLILVNTTR